jgi:hypothetical protein
VVVVAQLEEVEEEQVVLENLIILVLQVVTASPLATPTSLPVSVTTYPITVVQVELVQEVHPAPTFCEQIMDQIQFFQQ